MTVAQSASACMLTPAGRGGIAIVRVWGGIAREMVGRVFSNAVDISAGQLRFGKIISSGNVVDEAILACVTENEFEINIHGGSAVGRLTLDALMAAGCDVSSHDISPQFFSKHPDFDNSAIGKEMLEILPRAVSEFVLSVITSQWSGGLSALLSGEFSADDLRAAAGRFDAVQKMLNWPEVVIAGRPNAGKSTLANAFIGRDVSIVHPMAGTTRDWVRERALILGRPIWLTDTAGLWDASGLHDVDVQAVARAWKQIKQADLVILACCGEDEMHMPAEIPSERVLKIFTKADEFTPAAGALAVSAVTGQGIDELKTQIIRRLGLDKIAPDQPASFTQRQQILLNQAAESLESGDFSACRKITQKILSGEITAQ